MYFFHFISGWHCLFSLNIRAYKAKRHWKVWSQGFPSCWTLTIPSPPVMVNSAESLFSGVLLPGMAVYVMGSGVMWSMWWAQVWPLEPLQPFWGHEGRHQCHIFFVKAQRRTPGSRVVASNLELPCLDLLVIMIVIIVILGFPSGSVVRIHLPPQEMQVWSLGWEGFLEEEMATHSSILAWKIPWTEEPGRLQSEGSQRFMTEWQACTIVTVIVIPGNNDN